MTDQMAESMFRFIKHHLRTVGIGGFIRAVGAKASHSSVLFRVDRKGIPWFYPVLYLLSELFYGDTILVPVLKRREP